MESLTKKQSLRMIILFQKLDSVIIPTTREVLFLPSSLAGVTPSGTAAAAIFVMLIELVLVAKIASGRSSMANSLNMDCLRERFSDTAYISK